MENLLIKTDRLFIRTLLLKDKDDLFRYRSLPQVYRYQSWRPKQIDEAEEFILKNSWASIEKKPWLQLAICLNEGFLIGDIGIHFVDDYQIEIGYTISPEYQGKGYAFEAVRAVIDHAFSEWGKHRISASVDPDNIRSIKLLEKIGFRKEAHFLKSFRVDDKWYDDCVYAMLKEEWKGI